MVDVAGPHTGQAIRLEFQPDREGVGLVGVLPAEPLHFVGGTDEVLNVMTNLMGDHVGLSKSPGAPKRLDSSSKKVSSMYTSESAGQ